MEVIICTCMRIKKNFFFVYYTLYCNLLKNKVKYEIALPCRHVYFHLITMNLLGKKNRWQCNPHTWPAHRHWHIVFPSIFPPQYQIIHNYVWTSVFIQQFTFLLYCIHMIFGCAYDITQRDSHVFLSAKYYN